MGSKAKEKHFVSLTPGCLQKFEQSRLQPGAKSSTCASHAGGKDLTTWVSGATC